MHIFITSPARVYALYQCTQLIVGDQYSDVATMNFLGAKLTGGVAEAPPIWTLRATPRAVMDALQERGFELSMAQTVENQITWIMSKPDATEIRGTDERKRAGSAPSHHNIQSEGSMHSMPRGPRKVPVKTKPKSKEGVEASMTVVGVEPPNDEHHHSRKHSGENRKVLDDEGNPISGSADSIPMAESEHDTFAGRPHSGKSSKSKPRPVTLATNDHQPSEHPESSDEEHPKDFHEEPAAVSVKRRKSPPKEKKSSSPKKGSKKSIED